MDLVEQLSDPDTLYALEGSTAVLGKDEVVQTVHAADTVRVGEIPTLRKTQMIVRESWLCLGLFLLAGAFLLAALIRTWARRRGGQV